MQEAVTYLLVAVAVGALFLRWFRGRASGNCCGEKECPAARKMVSKIEQLR